jgi:CubicO group peptidase (beta-lactamase class C family)
MARLRLFLFLSIFIILAFPILEAQEAEMEQKNIDELKKEIEKILKEHTIPGATIALVSKEDILWVGGVGKSDIANGKDVEADSIFRWGSISKSFVSIAMLMLEEREIISLDDKIKDLAPEIEFQNRWELTHPIKIVHCLEHTTGFDDLHYKELAVNEPKITLSDGLVINPNSRYSRWRPGTYMSYCNVGPAIAAYILEKKTGKSFEEFVQENIFDPLGMKTASFFYPTEKDLMSKGYKNDGITEAMYDHIFGRCAGSLNASSKEMACFIQMLLNRGTFKGKKLLEPESVNRMETPTTTLAAQNGFPFGYGLGNYTFMEKGILFHGHEGGIAGFAACFGYNSELNLGFAVSINKVSGRGLEKIKEAIAAYLTAGIEKPEPLVVNLSTEELLPITGYYQQITPGTQLLHALLMHFVDIRRFTLENRKLYSENFISRIKGEILPLSKNSFHRKDRWDTHLFLIKNNGDYIISYDNFRGNYKRVSSFWVYFQFGIAIFSLLLMISSLIFALVWIPRKLLGKMKDVKFLRARIFSFLAVLFFFATYIPLLIGSLGMDMDKEMMMKLGTFTIQSFAIFIFSLCFVIFSLLGLIFSLQSFRVKMNKVARIHSILVSVANVIVVIYLWYNGVIGIQTWSY